uniref:Cytochrome b n=1 Tax=Perumytilus purpuratus TaxID=390823 RepID=A0A346KKZ4_PERPP|nr:cytochrome b [Perumytilus purpuratus]AXP84512.1 cytochrome b [Perumytilus purpuratus]
MRVSKPFRKRHWFLNVLSSSLYDLPCPVNLSIWWSFGSMLGLCLGVQIVSGFMLSLYYIPHADMAYDSVIYIVRNVHKGWMIRNIHANGASIFFMCIYVHIARGLYYGSYLDKGVWNVGVVLYLMLMAESFLGYVLPWGQMSYWGAVVITSMLTAVPYIGGSVVEYVWGGYVVNTRTLTRFYSVHFIMPFLMAVVIMLHLFYLHDKGSNNPLGISSDSMLIPFHPFYTVKDVVGFTSLLLVLMFFVCVKPEVLGNPLNYIPADSYKTPIHIEPEWYFLFAYTILRSIPHKSSGIIAMLMSILILFLLPFIHTGKFRGLSFYPVHQMFFWFNMSIFGGLTAIGMRPVLEPFYSVGQVLTFLYFFMMFFLPLSLFLWDYLISSENKK